MFCVTRAARAPEIACDSRKQKLYRLNWPLVALRGLLPVVQTLSKLSLVGDSGNECLTRLIEQKGYQKSPTCKAIFLVWETLNLHPKVPVQTSSTSCFHEKLCN